MTADPEPRWLDADEQEAWLALTVVLWMLPRPLEAQLQRDSDLTLFEYFVLAHLSMVPGRRLRMSELAATSNVQPSRLSNVVGRLEARGWIRREQGTCDRRSTEAVLTDDGFAVVEAAAPGHVEAVRRLVIDRLDPGEIRALRSVGEKLRTAIETEAAAPPA